MIDPKQFPGAPDPDARRRMVQDALKGTKMEQGMKDARPKTDEEKMQCHLASLTIEVVSRCLQIKKLAIESGQPWGLEQEHAMQKTAMSLWKDAFSGLLKEELHFMLCVVLTGATLEQVSSEYYDPPLLGGN